MRRQRAARAARISHRLAQAATTALGQARTAQNLLRGSSRCADALLPLMDLLCIRAGNGSRRSRPAGLGFLLPAAASERARQHAAHCWRGHARTRAAARAAWPPPRA
jgi:hypothetical protein